MTDSADALSEAFAAIDVQAPNTTLAQSALLGFDTETTGTRPGSDAIVAATLVLRHPLASGEHDVIGEWTINPHRRMDPRATAVNGFTDEFLVQHGMEPSTALAEISKIIHEAADRSIPLLAYNASFDVSMLQGDLARWNLPALQEALVVDPLVIDRAVSKRRGKRTLADTTEYYGVEPHGDFHNSTADTVAAVDLIKPMSTLHPEVGHLPLSDIMRWQRGAHAAWQASFNSWLTQHGRTPIHDHWL